MSLFFGEGSRIRVPIAVVDDPSSTEHVQLDQRAWDALTTGISIADEKIAVAIEPLAVTYGSTSSRYKFRSLVQWATLNDSTSQTRVSKSWAMEYPTMFSPSQTHPPKYDVSNKPTHHLTRVHPVTLSEIVLLAKSPESICLARADPKKLENHVFDSSHIVRSGGTITFETDSTISQGVHFPENSSPCTSFRCEYEVIMTQPVLQGTCKPGVTSFIVTAADFAEHTLSNSSSPVLSMSDFDSSVASVGFEIGEGFLANSIDPIANGSIGYPSRDSKWAWSDDSLARSPVNSLTNGTTLHADSETPEPSGQMFVVKPLQTVSSQPQVVLKGDDHESFAYVCASDISHLGIFSGDWAVLSNTPQGSPRLAKLMVDDFPHAEIERGALSASPMLIHNSWNNGQHLHIFRSPFGSRPPSLPTARSVTVARVSSPHANDRSYQPLFIRALKYYFENKIRLLKLGDLIAVPIHTEDARVYAIESGKDSTDSENPEEAKEFLLDQEFPLSSGVNTGVVFFKITNIEHDVVDIEQSTGNTADTYFAATMGEFGCWVDASVTKIMQTGLEHSRVPDVHSYLGINRGFAPIPQNIATATNTPFSKMLDLASASLLPTAVDYELHLSVLLKGARGIGKQTTARWVAQKLGLHLLEVNCYEVVGESDVKTEGMLRARMEKAADCSPCVLLLRHIEALARNSQALETGKEPPMATVLQECLGELQSSWKLTGFPVLVFATTTEPEKIPQGVLSCFKHEIVFEAPPEAEREAIISNLLRDFVVAPDVSTKSLAIQTAALVAADLIDLVQRAQISSVQRIMDLSPSVSEEDSVKSGMVLTGADFETGLNEARMSYSESIGAPKIPNVTWDDVGGLANVKRDILDTIQLPLEYPELFTDGLKKRSGILLYGPPGTGKTLLAKAVATSCSLNFFSIKGPELLNMYIGESEANVRRVFQRARDAKPCVIFFDELDSVAPKRGNHGDSGGVMDRIVSQLLAELDGMADGKGGADVFVIGATNRPDLLDSALLRPGRFDRMLYLGVSDSHDAQLNIMRALTRKFRLDPELDLNDIAQQCPFNYTGADFYALCSDAMLKSMSRKAEEVDGRIAELNALPPPYVHPHPMTPQYYLAEIATSAETDVLVSQQDFELALRELVPSVSQGEMDHYAEVQRKFANDTINAIKDEKLVSIDTNGSSSADGENSVTAPLVPWPDSRKGKGKARA